jgi:hypothetical protein
VHLQSLPAFLQLVQEQPVPVLEPVQQAEQEPERL